MATIKLYGSPASTATMRALATLHEKGLEFNFVEVDMGRGEHKAPPFLSLNPFGQVPAFGDGDFKLFESRAITKYISHTYAANGTPLIFDDPKKMAILSVWMEVEAHQFDAAASPLAFEIVFKPLFNMVTDPAAVEAAEAKLGKVLDVYESRLTESKYLGGDSFSLADLHHLPNISFLIESQVKNLFTSRPHVNAWCTDILARPAWAKVKAMKK